MCLTISAHQTRNVRAPQIEGCPFFVGVAVPLIHTNHTTERPAGMVQYLFNDRQTDAKARHAGGHRPPQVMQRPVLYAGNFINLDLGVRESRDRSCSGGAEQ